MGARRLCAMRTGRPVDYANDGTAVYLLESEDYLAKWTAYLRPYREMDTSAPALEVQTPKVRQVEWHRIKLSCRVFDRERVIASYAVELREGSAESGRKLRFMFQRSPNQRKVDEVRLELSRWPREASRVALGLDDVAEGVAAPPRRPQTQGMWSSKATYVFRVCALLAESRWGPRVVASEWTDPLRLP